MTWPGQKFTPDNHTILDTQAPGVWALRQRAYQCSGGPPGYFNLGTNDVANCKDTTIGRPVSNYGKYNDKVVSSNFYGMQDPTWCPMQPKCYNGFSYPWFPNVASPDKANWNSEAFAPPYGPGPTMFRLPVLPLSSRTCTPSPFVNASHYVGENRPGKTTWNSNVPTQCTNDMTLSITSLIGPGYYSAPVGQGAKVTLSLGADNNTVTCAWTLGTSLPNGLTVQNVTIVVTDGPVFAADDPLYSGNPASPYWQIGFMYVSGDGSPLTGSGSTLLSQALNASVARSYTRVVDCVVSGVNYLTGFPFTLPAAQPYVVETYGQGWLPYKYPMPGNYIPSTPAPTQAPTQAPTCVPAPAPAPPLTIGFSVQGPLGSLTVNPSSNTFSGYSGGAVVDYDVTASLAGGWANATSEYVVPVNGYVRPVRGGK